MWQHFPDVHFAFIGLRTSYSKKLFGDVTDRRILELNTVPLQEKTDTLAACTLLCVPSSQESFGGVYTEAWSFAKPVIGCNIPAVSEVIGDGIDGFLVEQRPDEIADRICQLIADPSLAEKMGRAGKQKVIERFTWERLAQKTEEVYKKLVN